MFVGQHRFSSAPGNSSGYGTMALNLLDIRLSIAGLPATEDAGVKAGYDS